MKCVFYVEFFCGDFLVFIWKIWEFDNYLIVFVYKGKKIIYCFVKIGIVNIIVNVSNDVFFCIKIV